MTLPDPFEDHPPHTAATGPLRSAYDWVIPLLRRWKAVAIVPMATGSIAAAVALALPETYTATTTFAPAVGAPGMSLPSGLAGLATQFGLNVGTAGNSFSPDFFAEVLRSRELLRATLLSEFEDPANRASKQTLLDILEIASPRREDRLSQGIRELRSMTTQRVDRRTAIVTLEVKGRSPELVAAVADRMVELLNTFNLERLRSQSRERRRFAGERKEEAERELRDAEGAHLRFLQSNRRYADSPLLSFEQDRLARQVQLRQEMFQVLTREYEEARIAEVRDTPVLTIIDPGERPDRRSFPPRKLIVVIAMFAGGLSVIALAYLAEYQQFIGLERGSRYQDLLKAWRDMKADLRAALQVRDST